MRFSIKVSDPFFLLAAAYLAITESGWWWFAVPVIIISWFFQPRWNKQDGWSFKP